MMTTRGYINKVSFNLYVFFVIIEQPLQNKDRMSE